MIDTTQLQTKLDELTAQVTATETVEAGAVQLINGFAAVVTAEVTKALDADNAADQGTITAVTAVIDQVRQRFTASGSNLGAAVIANTPSGPPTPPGPPPEARRR